MCILELYFIFYRVPRMMTRLARERGRSALKWSLLGVGAWIATEFFVIFIFELVYEVGVTLWGWADQAPAGLRLLAYLIALVAALLSTTFVSRILSSKSRNEMLVEPPPPPVFSE